jgi:hypothetical protein
MVKRKYDKQLKKDVIEAVGKEGNKFAIKKSSKFNYKLFGDLVESF